MPWGILSALRRDWNGNRSSAKYQVTDLQNYPGPAWALSPLSEEPRNSLVSSGPCADPPLPTPTQLLASVSGLLLYSLLSPGSLVPNRV